MHTFQPYPMELLEWNPMEKISKEWFAVVTEADGKVNAMTAGWGGIGHIWGKNATFIFIRESRYTKELLDKSDTFSVCFLDPQDKSTRSTLKFLGTISGRNEDKLAEAKLETAQMHGITYLDSSSMIILCRKMAAVDIDPADILDDEMLKQWYPEGDYHTMYVGEIVEIAAR